MLRLWTDRQEVSPAFYCDGCGTEIYPGHEYYELEGKIYCADCVYEAKKYAVS